MNKHLKILGFIYTTYGWLLLLLTVGASLFAAQDIGRIKGCEKEMNQSLLPSDIFNLIISLIIAYLIISIFYLIFGNALKNRKKWATRVVGFIVGILSLFSFPIGTLIGIYTIWVLSKVDQLELTKAEQPIGPPSTQGHP